MMWSTRLFLGLLALVFMETVAGAAVPDFVTYSGRLTDGTGWGKSTTVDLTFRVYGSAEGDDLLWQKEYPDLPVEDGYFNVLLGSGDDPATPQAESDFNITGVFADHDATWITVCAGKGCSALDDLAPRQQIGSLPYAIAAGSLAEPNAYIANGTSPQDATYSIKGSAIIGGTVGIGTDAPLAPLHVHSSAPVGPRGVASIVLDIPTNYPVLVVEQKGAGGNPHDEQGLLVDIQGTVTGTGHAFTVRGQSQYRLVVENSGNVGIGTHNPQTRLHLSGGHLRMDDAEGSACEIFVTNKPCSTWSYAQLGTHGGKYLCLICE